METTPLTIGVIAAIAGAITFLAGFEYGGLLYYGLMTIGVASLGYLFVKNQTSAPV